MVGCGCHSNTTFNGRVNCADFPIKTDGYQPGTYFAITNTGHPGCFAGGIYGLDSKMPFEEHDISIKLYTPYQVTKMLGELYTNYFYNLYGLPIVNARFFNSYGPGEVPGKYRNVIPNFFYWSMNGLPLPITGTGEETRDFTYVRFSVVVARPP